MLGFETVVWLGAVGSDEILIEVVEKVFLITYRAYQVRYFVVITNSKDTCNTVINMIVAVVFAVRIERIVILCARF